MGFRVLLENVGSFTLVLQYLRGLPQEPSTCPLRLPQKVLSKGMFTQAQQRQNPYSNFQLGREDLPEC